MDFRTEIFNLLNVANEWKTMNDEQRKATLLKIDEKWDALPDGKLQCNEKAILAMFMYKPAIDLSMMDMANKWVEILLLDRADDPTEFGIYKGELAFARKDYANAYKYFKMAYDDSKGRPFRERDPAYLDLVKNPSKYDIK